MAFIFQQPGTKELLKAIDNAALNADSGGGIFAFASRGGIDALFACPHISAMLRDGFPFHLIVGIDAITNAEALLCLSEKLHQLRGVLTAEVFLHAHPNSTFHPKFSWFRHGSDLRIVAGSGNLTLRGLGQVSTSNPPSGNWEAFTIQSFKGDEAAIVGLHIDDWLTDQHSVGTLCSLDDERVRDKAMANGQVRFATGFSVPRQLPAVGTSPKLQQDVTPLDGITFDTPEVLVREIPRNRPGQADVGQAALTQFFGYEGVAKTILIQYVSSANELGAAHEILLFVNQSRNYRLELSAIRALEYEVAENDSRMI